MPLPPWQGPGSAVVPKGLKYSVAATRRPYHLLTMSVLRPSEIRTWIHLPDWYLDPLEEGYGLVKLISVSCISYGWLRVSRAPPLLTTTTAGGMLIIKKPEYIVS